ncbi:hypothetical protein AQUCO_02200144v1 [Aquilegia coerulea]|uniref:Uncharacterized protein n=1 Tax=Aquilegia coerulea TaxID=218851 RepID=A0A2G5DDB5_AQUCA|nr:hypothetical protein AQUCO_02200144v1 [Aquilegia coerulea]
MLLYCTWMKCLSCQKLVTNIRGLGQILRYTVLWCVWRERNNKIFNDIQINESMLKMSTKITMWEWLYVAKEGTVLYRECSITHRGLNTTSKEGERWCNNS